jgi:hypothetical protein
LGEQVSKALIATAALTALAAFRLGCFVLGTVGLWHILGPAWALLGVASVLLLRFTLPIRIGVFLAAFYLWSLPWYVALILAAPRLLLMLPGLISTGLARMRHPRPVWRGVGASYP